MPFFKLCYLYFFSQCFPPLRYVLYKCMTALQFNSISRKFASPTFINFFQVQYKFKAKIFHLANYIYYPRSTKIMCI